MDLYNLKADRLLHQYQPLLHKILHQFQISKYHANYDDYLQELKIKLLELHHKFDGDALSAEDTPRFVHLAKRALYWRMLDLLRQEARRPDTTAFENIGEHLLADAAFAQSRGSSLAIETFLSQARAVLTAEEFTFLMFLIGREMTLAELAEIYDVTRQTIHNWQRNLQHKLADYKDLLRN